MKMRAFNLQSSNKTSVNSKLLLKYVKKHFNDHCIWIIYNY